VAQEASTGGDGPDGLLPVQGPAAPAAAPAPPLAATDVPAADAAAMHMQQPADQMADVTPAVDQSPGAGPAAGGAAGAAAGEPGCAQCGAARRKNNKKLQRCAGCGLIRYCSRECQKAHWKVQHRHECPAALADDAAG
jgi:hypothetical protein